MARPERKSVERSQLGSTRTWASAKSDVVSTMGAHDAESEVPSCVHSDIAARLRVAAKEELLGHHVPAGLEKHPQDAATTARTVSAATDGVIYFDRKHRVFDRLW